MAATVLFIFLMMYSKKQYDDIKPQAVRLGHDVKHSGASVEKQSPGGWI
jgi:hypothetical protein